MTMSGSCIWVFASLDMLSEFSQAISLVAAADYTALAIWPAEKAAASEVVELMRQQLANTIAHGLPRYPQLTRRASLSRTTSVLKLRCTYPHIPSAVRRSRWGAVREDCLPLPDLLADALVHDHAEAGSAVADTA
eukprot:1728008-Amphidinium_carterae.2